MKQHVSLSRKIAFMGVSALTAVTWSGAMTANASVPPVDDSTLRGISPGAPLSQEQLAENLQQDREKFDQLLSQRASKTGTLATAAVTSNYLGVNHSAQAQPWWCAPASVRSALLQRNVNITQTPLADQLNTTQDDGTAWTGVNADVPSPSGRPVRDVLNHREPGSWNYAAVDVQDHTSGTQSTYRSKLMFNINASHALVAGIYEHPQEAHLTGHPLSVKVWHYVSLRGFSSSGATTAIDDPVSGSTVSWAGGVPAQSNVGSAKMIKLMEPHNGQGAYGYVW